MRPILNQYKHFKTASFMGLLCLMLNIIALTAFSQTAGDYRTNATGAWNSVNTWERFNGTIWVTPAPSTPTSADGIITIRAAHNINIPSSFSVTADEISIAGSPNTSITIDNGGTLILANGTGNDLAFVSALSARGRLFINGTFTIEQDAVISNITNSGKLQVGATGVYQHDYTTTEGEIYAATWAAGSTLEFTGYTTNAIAPAGLSGVTFENVIWNCTNQDGDIDLDGTLTQINGNFTISSTNTDWFLLLSDASDYTLNITGNLNISGNAIVYFSAFSGAVSTVNVTGNFNNSSNSSSSPPVLTGGSGNATINISGNYVGNDHLTLSEGSGIGTLNVTGNFTHNAGTIDETSSGSGAITFNGTSLQTFSSAGNFSGTINWTVSSNAIVSLGTSFVSGSGTFTTGSNSQLRVGSAAGIVTGTTSGNIRVSGTRTYSATTTFVYDGSVAQATGNGLPATVSNLTINNASDVTLTSATSVSGSLALSAGKIVLNNINLTITATGAISGASSARYIVTNGNGVLTINSVGNSNVLFPVGLSATYNPAIINNVGTIDNISGRVFSGTLGGAALEDVVNRTWDFSEAVANGSNFTITLQWNVGEEGANFDRNNCGVGHFVGGVWDKDALGVAQGSDPYTDDRAGITSFGQFGVGDDVSPLPIVLMSFSAILKNKGQVDLSWTTASELNNEYFDVEFSRDGTTWDSHGTVEGAGTSNTILNYTFTDNLEQQLLNTQLTQVYYRLKQVDFDGKFEYSAAVPVKLIPAPHAEASFFPNPLTDVLNVVYAKGQNENILISLMDMSGKNVQTMEINDRSGSGTVSMQVSDLLPGIYLIRIDSGSNIEYRRVVKQ